MTNLCHFDNSMEIRAQLCYTMRNDIREVFMLYAFLAVFAVLIVIADQITKYLTVANIPLHEHLPSNHSQIPRHFDPLHQNAAALAPLENLPEW